ncbi:RICIN domain-containing protein [Streptosporangium sp. NPDC087985]|uniref:RICIN domain-containing protein n=1 Tax=Streptosporangium sp. NPDC087985 TaxID=3366196 RepID=UPI003800ADE8
MRIRLAFAAGVLAAAAPVALAAPDALASALSPVEPGTYEIVNTDGHCLRSEGAFNSKAPVGACDTRWKVAPSGHDGGFTITHATTGNCLAVALERIYPPLAATLPCDMTQGSAWTLADAGDGQVTISLRGSSYLTDMGDNRPTVLLEPRPEGQHWTLRAM